MGRVGGWHVAGGIQQNGMDMEEGEERKRLTFKETVVYNLMGFTLNVYETILGAWIMYFADAPTLAMDFATFSAPGVAYATVAVLTVDPQRIVAANVGDSRIYVIRDGQIERLSRDHTMLAEQMEK